MSSTKLSLMSPILQYPSQSTISLIPPGPCAPSLSFDRDARQRLPSSLLNEVEFNDEQPTARFSLNVPSSWEDHPDYGFIHRQGCQRCTAYMEHINSASLSQDPMLTILLRLRDDRHDANITEGRRLQKEDDREGLDRLKNDLAARVVTLRRYRLERNEARQQVEETKALLLESQAETARLKAKLHKLESAAQDSSLSSGEEDSGYVSCTSAPRFESPTWSNESSLPNSPSANEQSFAASAQRLSESSGSPSPSSPPPVRSYAAAASVTSPTSPPSHTITIPITTNATPLSPTTPTPLTAIAITSPVLSPSSTVPTTGIATTRKVVWPKKRTDLDWLMKAAHRPGQERILFRVKGLCADAHATPREQKTEMMKYLLANWRNPANLADSPSAQNNPRLEDPVEDWYRYLKVHSTSWPRGVPKDEAGGPSMPELRASRAVRRMYPATNQAEFVTAVVALFGVPGRYRTLVEEREMSVRGSTAYTAYVPPEGGMSVEDIAAHFARCGVNGNAAMFDFEPWAREYVATTTNAMMMNATTTNNANNTSTTAS